MIWITLVVAIMTFAGYGCRIWWGFTAFDFPRLQYVVISLAALIFALSEFEMIYAGIHALLVAINLHRIRGFWPKFNLFQKGPRQIMVVNTYRKNKAPDRLRSAIDKADPEILLLLEINDWLEKELDEQMQRYLYRLETPVRDGFKICLLSKKELMDTEVIQLIPDTPLLKAKVMLDGKKYQIFSAHPKPAISEEFYLSRNRYFKELVEPVKTSKHPCILLGDFNSVPWEDHFQNFQNSVGLFSSLKGRGYKVTWPVFSPFVGVPMDHILIPAELKCRSIRVGPYVGSDHFPISINLTKK